MNALNGGGASQIFDVAAGADTLTPGYADALCLSRTPRYCEDNTGLLGVTVSSDAPAVSRSAGAPLLLAGPGALAVLRPRM